MSMSLETMTVRELRADIPALQEGSYLNFGAHGPSPRYVIDAMHAFLEQHEYDVVGQDPYEHAFETYEDARSAIATFIGAESHEIALTESTTDGVNRIAQAIDWEPGDVVVRTDLEHPAGILPWQQLAQQGVEVRVLETSNGRVDRDAFAEAVVDARLVFFSSITWTHGTRLPVRELVDIAHDAGALTFVDAVQSPGQREMDVHSWGADAVAAAGHKWLLGPWGAGFLYIDGTLADQLTPGAIGYRSVETPTDPEITYTPGAPRFELGSSNPAPHVGLMEAIDTISEVGLPTIEQRIERLTDRLKDGLGDDRLLSPRAFESGLVTVRDETPEETVEELANEHIVIRPLPFPNAVRVSVHAVTTEHDVDRVVNGLTRSA